MRLFKAISISLVLAAPVGAVAQDYSKGLAAFEAGDYGAALQEWRPLAEQGDDWAQYSLGQMYRLGDGVLQDYVLSHMWYNISGANGYAASSDSRDLVVQTMTREQLADAQERARRCMESNYQDCG
jgi:TPR repeat protein